MSYRFYNDSYFYLDYSRDVSSGIFPLMYLRLGATASSGVRTSAINVGVQAKVSEGQLTLIPIVKQPVVQTVTFLLRLFLLR